MSFVIAKPNESFESLMRRFKKAVEKSGILADYRKHESFEKPSVQKKRKSIAAQKRAKKNSRTDFVKKSNVNFKFSADRTRKIPTDPPKKRPVDFKKRRYNSPPIRPTQNRS